MNGLTFAPWVEPLASQMSESRRRVVEFARAQDAAFWDAASVVEGWSNRDLLAHIGGANDQMLQEILRAVVSGRDVPAEVLTPDTEGENARRVAERRSWPVKSVISEVEATGAEMQALLAGLREEHADLHPGGAAWTMRSLLGVVLDENHDIEHLEQLLQAAVRTDLSES